MNHQFISNGWGAVFSGWKFGRIYHQRFQAEAEIFWFHRRIGGTEAMTQDVKRGNRETEVEDDVKPSNRGMQESGEGGYRKDGKSQLQDYLRFSKAYLGVWFNGDERLFLRKIENQGKIFFEEIPNNLTSPSTTGKLPIFGNYGVRLKDGWITGPISDTHKKVCCNILLNGSLK